MSSGLVNTLINKTEFCHRGYFTTINLINKLKEMNLVLYLKLFSDQPTAHPELPFLGL